MLGRQRPNQSRAPLHPFPRRCDPRNKLPASLGDNHKHRGVAAHNHQPKAQKGTTAAHSTIHPLLANRQTIAHTLNLSLPPPHAQQTRACARPHAHAPRHAPRRHATPPRHATPDDRSPRGKRHHVTTSPPMWKQILYTTYCTRERHRVIGIAALRAKVK